MLGSAGRHILFWLATLVSQECVSPRDACSAPSQAEPQRSLLVSGLPGRTRKVAIGSIRRMGMPQLAFQTVMWNSPGCPARGPWPTLQPGSVSGGGSASLVLGLAPDSDEVQPQAPR